MRRGGESVARDQVGSPSASRRLRLVAPQSADEHGAKPFVQIASAVSILAKRGRLPLTGTRFGTLDSLGWRSVSILYPLPPFIRLP